MIDAKRYNRELDKIEDTFEVVSKRALRELKKELEPQLKLIQKGEADTIPLTLFTEFRKQHRENVRTMIKSSYQYGRLTASAELNEKTIGSSDRYKKWERRQVNAIVSKHIEDIRFKLVADINNLAKRNQLSEAEIQLGVREVLGALAVIVTAFLSRDIVATAAIATATGFNIGRDDTYVVYEEKIVRYEYSAILDNVTTGICKDLDGTVWNTKGFKASKWSNPPNHWNCRSMIISYKDDQVELPPLKREPKSPGGYSEPLI